MGFLGGALLMLRIAARYSFQGGGLVWTVGVLTAIAFFSNVLWLPIGTFFATRRPSVWTALLIGAASSLFGCLLIMVRDPRLAIAVFARVFYILLPVGLLTGYLVWYVAVRR